MSRARFFVPLALSFTLAGLSAADAGRGKSKKSKAHHYHGAHPLSVKPEAGFCYIEVPHVHATPVHNKHKPLYRDHEGRQSFVADPVAYGYEGPRHSYYGHHPIAVEVVLGETESYTSGQQLEYCYLEGPHHHLYAPQPGISFTQAAGASWYVGELPEAYIEGKVRYAPVNRVYATVEMERPEVVFESPPAGYVGPIFDVHVHTPDLVVEPAHVDVDVHGHGHGHAAVGVEVHIPTPTIEVGFGLGGVIVDDHHHHGKQRKYKSHKRKHKKSKRRRHW